MNKYRKLTIYLLFFGMVSLLIGITYSFFNYTRTGGANTISVGRISFVTRQTETINLTNAFPIDRTDIDTDTDNVDEVVIEIEGDTDYSGGIEYLISSVDSEIYTSTGQLVPISLDIDVDDLGTSNANYFTVRENTNASIYKKLVGDTLAGDQMLLVGYIVPNTTSGTVEGIDGSITIKAFFDKDVIVISDTYDGNESDNNGTTNEWAEGKTVLTTTEWNALQTSDISFKIKVEANEGIWVVGSLEEIMKRDNIGIDAENNVTLSAYNGFHNILSTNGIYMRTGTENDDNPILYYRGAVEDNNVKFANKCWKAVRTTDTGGVKLIYNGEYSTYYNKEYTDVDTYLAENDKSTFDFNETTKSFNISIPDSEARVFQFKIPAGSNYKMVYEGETSLSGPMDISIYYNNMPFGGIGIALRGYTFSRDYTFYSGYPITDDTVIKIVVIGNGTSESPATFSIKMQQNNTDLEKSSYAVLTITESNMEGCDNNGNDSSISVEIDGVTTKDFKYNLNGNSPAYLGYMYGTVYESNYTDWIENARFGSSFTWDGTQYTLVDDTVTVPDTTHHYSCNSTVQNGTCSSIRYVFVYDNYYEKIYYLTIMNGDGIDEILSKMNENISDSNAKTVIDTWYQNNMLAYTNKLEDTVWCSDRTYSNSSNWNANGGNIDNSLYYSAQTRNFSFSNRIEENIKPSLDCANKNDRFTVKNSKGNRKLTYPIALLTYDEVVLAGGIPSSSNGGFYLDYTNNYWLLTPVSYSCYENTCAYVGNNYTGTLSSINANGLSTIRPVISIKPGQLITRGTGAANDPYVIE